MKIMFSAGEASGDMHGANLARAFRQQDPSVELIGMGGDCMAEAGVRIIYDIKNLGFIGIGEILRAVIMSPVVTTADTSLLHGVVASIVYAILGIILFVTGYMFINLWHRKYNLSEEIMRGNTAAGILVFGIFVGLALVVSGAVH